MTRKIFALAICILTSISSFAQTPPDNEVWYTTTDGKKAELDEGTGYLDIQIISHTYDNGKGVVRANRAIEDYGHWVMEEEESGFKIIGNNIETITLPNRLTEIGYDAFDGCTSLKSFKGKFASADGRCLIVDGELMAFAPAGLTSYTIPYGVTTISSAFEGCTSLTSITIPDSVTWIRWCAFSGCTSLKSINIPDSVTVIGGYAFAGCTSLTSINIPNSVTEIGGSAFSGCTSLKSITIPDRVTEIWGNTFSDCTSLTNITIPDSVTEITGSAFDGCTSLKSFNGKYASADGRCLIKDGVLFAFAPAGLTSYTIPYGVTEIEGGAFRGCTSLTSITILDGVTVIGESAFYGCTSLTNITIPDSVTVIGESAFYGCTSLTNINVPNSVTEIESSTFEGCTSLTNITIPDSVTEISGSAFDGCKSLKSFKGKFASADGRCLIKDAELIAFAPAGLTSYTIPYGVTEIWGAFEGCKSLTSITIPDGVTEIGRKTFHGCTSLTSINIPDSVTEIGDYAFYGCTSLTNITIPDSVTKIGWGAFEGCTSLTSISIPDSITEIGSGAFEGCTNLTSITIPNSGIEIGDGAFEDCNIERITINAVTGNIFGGYDGLDPSKVVAYTGKYASEDGRCLIKDGVLIDYIHNGAERYEIPNGVTKISDEVFKGCSSLKSITIPESVTIIRSSAFKNCTNLTSITIPNSGIGIEYSAFEGCNIEQITINAVTGNIFRGRNGLDPSKVVAYIGKYASEDGRCLIKDGVLIDIIHTGLTSYDIPDGVTTIPDDTFRGCTKLASLTLPQSLTTIGERAFMGCGITEITIPQGVATIGQDAFKECPSVLILKCLATIPPQIATLGIGEEIVIYVPKESVKLYKKANVWMDYKKQIKPIKE